ncbi:N,N-dimethylformamidase beta subunit family domain-containing protein [Amycolatopsis cihanbeyliensis]|uniref:N,N-dimethylformamidase beta subunit family domain-containing protein n=1 Tax=Amycolatopsis cihanbeyliensis TaxID=1128664 RepID=UPI001154EF8A|nr:N,N-dimethylformamidase beta subunit family domain-containing protein [Amycolatopsis cihanbeyliensis]
MVQWEAGSVNGDAGVTVTLPAATDPGNRVVVAVAGNTTLGTPAGWTRRDRTVNWLGHYLFDKAGDGAAEWEFTAGTASQLAWVALEIAGGEFDAVAAEQAVWVATRTARTPELIPAPGERLLIASVGGGTDGAPSRSVSSWLSGFTELADLQVTGGADNPSHALAVLEATVDGVTPYQTAVTWNGNVVSHARILASYATGSGGPAEPTVTAGTARPVLVGGSVGLDVRASAPEGQTITGYAWRITSGGGSLSDVDTATPGYTAPATPGLAVVRCTVTASGGGSATAAVSVSRHHTIVAAENALPGTARAEWDLVDPELGGIASLQGFAEGFSANRDRPVEFKIAQEGGADWSARVYRLGWYGGEGARLLDVLTPDAAQLAAARSQPAPGNADPGHAPASADCSTWAVTLSWDPPHWAPSGIYLLRLEREGGGASHVPFVLRDDARTADLMVMPADSTWQAYNAFGGLGDALLAGNSLYLGTAINQYSVDCARYVHYDRPIVNRAAANTGQRYGAVRWSNFFTGEYPMVRFLERNGYDVKYYSCLDAAGDPDGDLLRTVSAAMFVGHNEYWSADMRSGWEAAKERGLSVFSCAGNEVFWRAVGDRRDDEGRPRRWECQKSTINGRGGNRPEWTGTWRDPDGSGEGGDDPENRFTGTIFCVNGPDFRPVVVPVAGGYSATPLWRDTPVAELSSGSWTSPGQILGFEWDTYGPEGVSTTGGRYLADPHPEATYCSSATYQVNALVLTDAGDEYGSGRVTHRLVVQPSGSAGGITFGTGTVNWALGVDAANTYQAGGDNTSTVLRQATVNLLTDMSVRPATLMTGLVPPTPVRWYPDP